MKSYNFDFLAAHDDVLVRLCAQAERYYQDDPNVALIKLRQFAEAIAKRVAANLGQYQPGEAFNDLLSRLSMKGTLTGQILSIFHSVRIAGNKAAHEGHGTVDEALHKLKLAFAIGAWYHQTFGNQRGFTPPPFKVPPGPVAIEKAQSEELALIRDELDRLRAQAQAATLTAQEQAEKRAEAEALAGQLAKDLEAKQTRPGEGDGAPEEKLVAIQIQASAAPNTEIESLKAAANQNGQALYLDEAATRKLIDEQLRLAGWEADTETLNFKKGARPQAGRNVAIAEWQTTSGPADYVLFAGLTPLAVVEAKRQAKSVPGALEQSKRYSRDYVIRADEVLPKPLHIKVDFSGWPEASVGEGRNRFFKIPFLFATNGRPYHRQIETESGIWHLDVRRPTNKAQALMGWVSPEGLQTRLAMDQERAEARLQTEPFDNLGLRDYQVRAIKAVEKALSEGKRHCLLAMATGTGKTKTTIGLIHRLLSAGRFQRVLFLVDRESLGEQAQNAFKEMQVGGNLTFSNVFEVKELGDKEPESQTRVQVATIQGMVRRLFFNGQDNPIPIDRYDCIIVDESHRGYNLDREMAEGELFFRNFAEYVSTYRRVLDYFDAVKVGLTATPALHTKEIFGEPAFVYSYREAVIDGFLIDHDTPIRMVTALAKHGLHLSKGEKVTVLAPTGTVETTNLPDEMDFDVDDFNKRVIAPAYTQVVCEELANHIDPMSEEKTLVFCVNDRHADQVVEALRDTFKAKYGDLDHSTITKITGASDKPMELIRRYKNERLPNVAVTVDLLTTGIDVPKICNLVFLRRVRSRILYEQMLGRATRMCKEIEKEVFRIFDAVDLYSILDPVSTMKPVVVDPKIPIGQLIDELIHDASSSLLGFTEQRSHADEVLDQVIVRFRRRLQQANKIKQLPEEWGVLLDGLEAVLGFGPDKLPEKLSKLGVPGSADLFKNNQKFRMAVERLFAIRLDGRENVFVTKRDDRVVEVSRGYGEGNQRPEDYLDAFGKFLESHMNEIPALIAVTQRPRDLTRQQLKELKLALDEANFRERDIQRAWSEVKNQDIAASIIGFIRQRALGDPLVPYEHRVDRALAKIKAMRPWTDQQVKWLNRLANQFKQNIVLDRASLDEEPFRKDGGYERMMLVLERDPAEVLGGFVDAIWNNDTASYFDQVVAR